MINWHKVDNDMQKYRDEQLDDYLEEDNEMGVCEECGEDFKVGKLTTATVKFQDGSTEEWYLCNSCYKQLRSEGKI